MVKDDSPPVTWPGMTPNSLEAGWGVRMSREVAGAIVTFESLDWPGMDNLPAGLVLYLSDKHLFSSSYVPSSLKIQNCSFKAEKRDHVGITQLVNVSRLVPGTVLAGASALQETERRKQVTEFAFP